MTTVHDMYPFTAANLRKLPTIITGQADDLKLETKSMRVWLSRCGVADGEPYENKVTVEMYNSISGKWENVEEYYGGK